ncbi:aminotransferase class IV [Thermus thermamylovorans]|uniref:4-amino-4-deoxychorismate lyase n=1 Tax=Thermus thermamylovorans TaxID=2509362 RepID=A0A4Q9B8Z0_9DEIN|nr:aminotransferase class IV [Thermus thermamylovorans]TBH21788.1 4-amino-4-deoxychorismate lyase [Thermus thermamylovorans]
MRRVLLRGEPFVEGLPESLAYHGLSVFTTLRVERGEPLWLEEHLFRLRRHGEALGLPYPGDGVFLADLRALQDSFSGVPCLRLRFTLGEGVWLSEARPHTPPPLAAYREGVRVHLTRHRVHPDLARYKTGNYLPYRLALGEARGRGAFEGLLQDAEGHVVDGSRTSPLLYREGTLYLLEGGLEGITREKVAAGARALGLRVERVYLRPEGLRGLLLLAGSGVGLLPAGPPPEELAPLIRALRPACYTG